MTDRPDIVRGCKNRSDSERNDAEKYKSVSGEEIKLQRQRSLFVSLEAGGNIDLPVEATGIKGIPSTVSVIISLVISFFLTCIPLVEHPHLTKESVLY